jgi:hypothetical protein
MKYPHDTSKRSVVTGRLTPNEGLIFVENPNEHSRVPVMWGQVDGIVAKESGMEVLEAAINVLVDDIEFEARAIEQGHRPTSDAKPSRVKLGDRPSWPEDGPQQGDTIQGEPVSWDPRVVAHRPPSTTESGSTQMMGTDDGIRTTKTPGFVGLNADGAKWSAS